MSIRSAANTDLVLRNLTITGTLTQQNPVTVETDYEIENLTVTNDSQLNTLYTSGETNVKTFKVREGAILDQTLEVKGDATFNTITTTGKVKAQKLEVDTDATITTDLSVLGNTTLNTVTTTGKIKTHKLEVDTTANITTDVTIGGNLTVTGTITSSNAVPVTTTGGSMEIRFDTLTGDGANKSGTIQLLNNPAENTNYAVFPSIYDGYTGGSSGTYTLSQTSSAIKQIVISDKKDTQFTWNLSKDNADNVNCYLIFLIVYGVPDCGYAASYTGKVTDAVTT
jgi:hypothetical protein